jgi:hypothetical protein
LKITHISETILSILTKLCPNVPWVIPSRVASQNHLVKLDSCFQNLSTLYAKYQSSGIAGSQEEDF